MDAPSPSGKSRFFIGARPHSNTFSTINETQQTSTNPEPTSPLPSWMTKLTNTILSLTDSGSPSKARSVGPPAGSPSEPLGVNRTSSNSANKNGTESTQ